MQGEQGGAGDTWRLSARGWRRRGDEQPEGEEAVAAVPSGVAGVGTVSLAGQTGVVGAEACGRGSTDPVEGSLTPPQRPHCPVPVAHGGGDCRALPDSKC